MGKLCATPFGVDVVGITEVIAITGALVGGTRPWSCCKQPYVYMSSSTPSQAARTLHVFL